MQTRRLGRSDISVAPWCFGGNVLGWTADEKTSFELLDAFVSAGFDFIDTADVYSNWVPGHAGGESETVIGNWLAARGNRDKVVIATKVGMGQPGRKGRLDRAYIAESIEGSLKCLRTDYVDLYQSHADDDATPIEETLEAYGVLVKAGKVRIIGASNFSAERLGASLAASAANGLPRYETLQPHYNLVDRDGFEGALQRLCVEEEVGVIPYFGLASGFLTGKYRSEADFGKSHAVAAWASTSTRVAIRSWRPSTPYRPVTPSRRPRWPWPGSWPSRRSRRRSPARHRSTSSAASRAPPPSSFARKTSRSWTGPGRDRGRRFGTGTPATRR